MSELRCGTCGQKDELDYFNEGFDAAINMVLNLMDYCLFAEQIPFVKEEILEEAGNYKKDR